MIRWCDRCEMVADYCEHGNPPTSDLSQSKQWQSRDPDCTEGEDGPTIQAQAPGTCPTCDGSISPGDWIRHVADGWVHSPPRETSGRPPRTDASMFEGMD